MIRFRPTRTALPLFAAVAVLFSTTLLLTPDSYADTPTAEKHFLALPSDGQGHFGGGTPLQGVHRIVCLGDSITQFGDGPTGYVGLLRGYLTKVYPPNAIEVVNAGVSGNTSNDELSRLDRDVIQKKPDLVTISVGVNDVWHGFDNTHPSGGGPNGVPLDLYKTNVQKMVTAAQKTGCVVVILAPTVIMEDLNDPRNLVLADYVSALKDIARRHKCLFVDLQTPFQTYLDLARTTGNTDKLLTVDGVHMNDWGNRFMAATILTSLLSPAPKGVTLHTP